MLAMNEIEDATIQKNDDLQKRMLQIKSIEIKENYITSSGVAIITCWTYKCGKYLIHVRNKTLGV